ncbi:MAG: hypothetical protein Kow00127_09680 [Bacteroidales bacterium]
MIENKDIIVMGIQPWDLPIGSNCKNIAETFSKHNRVLYVNAPLDRASKHKEKDTEKIKKRLAVIRGTDEGLVQLNGNMWNLYPDVIVESINSLPDGPLYDYLNKINNKRFARSILNAAAKLGFSNYLLFNDQHMFLGYYMKELLNPAMYIYYMRDNLVRNPYWRKHGKRLEPKLIAKADLVVNNSLYYTAYGKKYNPHSYMVGQGCDVSLFYDPEDKIKMADDLGKIPRPIIGYVGYLTHRRLDLALLEFLAKSKPDWQIVLVGPEDEAFQASTLHQKSNVHFLGPRKPEELPAYVKGFDVCMNPQVVNEATIGNYPRKIDEYLAMGKPTIGTRTEAMEYFADVCYLASSHEDYITLIEKALKENTPELEQKRIETGLSHSWDNNVKEIYRYIRLVAEEKKIQL